MILYVNGDSHAAAAEAACPHAWSEDDGELWNSGKGPHPLNDAVSFGRQLATALNADYYNHSQSGCSNSRIIRTTKQWIQENPQKLSDLFMLIQWTTWERQEWFHDNEWWQVNASGADIVPLELANRYKEFVINVDWHAATLAAHSQIWNFHCELVELNIPHLFFNGNNHFDHAYVTDRKNWHSYYIEPYNKSITYNQVLKNNGFQTVNPKSYHFGADAHRFWSEFLLQYIRTHNLIDSNALSTN